MNKGGMFHTSVIMDPTAFFASDWSTCHEHSVNKDSLPADSNNHFDEGRTPQWLVNFEDLQADVCIFYWIPFQCVLHLLCFKQFSPDITVLSLCCCVVGFFAVHCGNRWSDLRSICDAEIQCNFAGNSFSC